MFKSGVAGATQANLGSLAKLPFVKKYYLAGGTATALHLGHRLSYDLDFFSPTPEDPQVLLRELETLGLVDVVQNERGTFNGVLNQGKISFFIYPYPLIRPTVEFEQVNIASLEDIICMKLEVVSSRGSKRDFIDLFFLLKHIPLSMALELFMGKFKKTDVSVAHVMKSLTYFNDADPDMMPTMLEQVDWGEIKQFFENEARNQAHLAGLI